MLIVTHELQALSRVLTRIIQINQGRVTFDGPPANNELSQASPGPALDDHDGHHHDGDDDLLPRTWPAAGPLDRLPGFHDA